MKTLHLFTIKDCHMSCPLCCNKGYKIDELPVVTVKELQESNIVCITGGEPFLIPINKLIYFIYKLRKQYVNIEKVYIYSTGRFVENPTYKSIVDGISFGPKSEEDWNQLIDLIPIYKSTDKEDRLLSRKPTFSNENRLYVFPEWEDTYNDISKEIPNFNEILHLEVFHRKWQKDFIPAKDSIFRRLPVLF